MTTVVPKGKEEDIERVVRERYGQIAQQGGLATGCGCGAPSATDVAARIGYSDGDVAAVPDGANLGLGCGAPLTAAALRPGETVLDLGSGAGFDAFLAAREVGPSGRVIGVDMTDAMIAKGRENIAKAGATRVEIRKGII